MPIYRIMVIKKKTKRFGLLAHCNRSNMGDLNKLLTDNMFLGLFLCSGLFIDFGLFLCSGLFIGSGLFIDFGPTLLINNILFIHIYFSIFYIIIS